MAPMSFKSSSDYEIRSGHYSGKPCVQTFYIATIALNNGSELIIPFITSWPMAFGKSRAVIESLSTGPLRYCQDGEAARLLDLLHSPNT